MDNKFEMFLNQVTNKYKEIKETKHSTCSKKGIGSAPSVADKNKKFLESPGNQQLKKSSIASEVAREEFGICH